MERVIMLTDSYSIVNTWTKHFCKLRNIRRAFDARRQSLWPRSPKACVWGSSLVEIAGSNPAEGMEFFLLWVFWDER